MPTCASRVSSAYARLDAAVTDDAFAYSTNRTIVIKDRRIGLLLLALRVGILIYIIVEAVTEQLYLTPSDLAVSVRLQLREPARAYRWGVGAGPAGQAPFCLGATSPVPPSNSLRMLAPYDLSSAATYRFNGAGPFPRQPCAFLDAALAAPLSESDRAFLITDSARTAQALVEVPAAAGGAPGPPCASTLQPGCVWWPPSNLTDQPATALRYVPDVEYFTVFVDHSMIAPLAIMDLSGIRPEP